jgi:dihydrofolate reductase
MSRIIVTNSLSLDGVIQAPGRADEDTRDGFTHGGWAQPYNDEVMGVEMGKGMARTTAMLFGRRTYEGLAAFWPHQTDGNPYTEMLNNTQKYVVSTTLTDPLPWQNSTVVGDDVVATVTKLKEQPGDIAILGSGALIRSLIPHGLIDEYILLIHPLTLGSGQRLFPEDSSVKLKLINSIPTTTGVIIATFQPA